MIFHAQTLFIFLFKSDTIPLSINIMKEGFFIVIYGANNMGKTTQVDKLINSLNGAGVKAQKIKYPIYDLEPTGPKINEQLRGASGQTLSEDEFQDLYIQNRFDYQPQLVRALDEGMTIIAEDYVGTGMAWGWTKGLDVEILIEKNKGLLKPDVEILLDGERFEVPDEKNIHEKDDSLWLRSRRAHLELAARLGWDVVNANQEVEEVHQEILNILEKRLNNIK